MNNELEQQLRRIVSAVHFRTADDFSFAGRSADAWSGGYRPQAVYPQQSGGPHPAVQALQNILYGQCYSRPFSGAIHDDNPASLTRDDAWLDGLSEANASRDRWDEGWRVQQFLPNGQVYAQKGGASRAFWPGEFLTRGSHGMQPQPGTPISAFLARESRNIQPGFYFVFGETPGDQQDDYSTVRYYWNARHESARPLVRRLTQKLNRYQTPFKFKVVSYPGMIGRSDSAILYVGRRYYRIAAEIARETHAELGPLLGEATPLFSRRLARGLSFAEDPGSQESFGMSRCRMLAEGLHDAHLRGLTSPQDRLARVAARFEAAGASLERPHLNLGSIDPYEFPQ